jgi:hypothetical protein
VQQPLFIVNNAFYNIFLLLTINHVYVNKDTMRVTILMCVHPVLKIV